MLTTVRRRVTWDNRDRRGRLVDPEWANRRRLLTAAERLRPERFSRMWNAVADGDPSGQILAAYIAKEHLRALLGLARARPTRGMISNARYRFGAWCALFANVPEIVTLAETIDTWWPEIEAFLRLNIPTPEPRARTAPSNRSSESAAASPTRPTTNAVSSPTRPHGTRRDQPDQGHPSPGTTESRYNELPRPGRTTGARVLAEIGDDRPRFSTAKALKAYAGLAPVTRASGKSKIVMYRRVKNNRLAATGYLWAFAALTKSPAARAHYDQRRARGDRHAAALRHLFNRMIGQLRHCLEQRSGYDEREAFADFEPTPEPALAA